MTGDDAATLASPLLPHLCPPSAIPVSSPATSPSLQVTIPVLCGKWADWGVWGDSLATQSPVDLSQDVYLFFLPASLPTTLLCSLTQVKWKGEALKWGDEGIQDEELKGGEGWRQVKKQTPFHTSGTCSSAFPVLPR